MKAKYLLKRLINASLEPFGLEIRLKADPSRNSMQGALKHIKKFGFYPKTIIDVGAAIGTKELYDTFPSSKLVLIEPLEEFKPYLNKVIKKFPKSEYIMAAASKKSGEVKINVHPDLFGSSLYLENENSNVNGVPRVVPVVTLDEVCKKLKLQRPYLIKIDVQGAELDVLRGGINTLDGTEYIVLEVVLFKVFLGGPEIIDVITFMRENGFVVYEIFHPLYRPLDRAMSQVDIAFVKESGQFRRYHFYASREQRKAKNRDMTPIFRTSLRANFR